MPPSFRAFSHACRTSLLGFAGIRILGNTNGENFGPRISRHRSSSVLHRAVIGIFLIVPLIERWVYVVSYTPPPRDCQDCMATPFSIVVTMDGNAVAAVVSRWKPPTPSVNE